MAQPNYDECTLDFLEESKVALKCLLDTLAAGITISRDGVGFLYRTIHTIRGGAQMMQIKPLVEYAFELEDYLKSIQDNNADEELKYPSLLVDSLECGIALCQSLASGEALPHQLSEISDSFYVKGVPSRAERSKRKALANLDHFRGRRALIVSNVEECQKELLDFLDKYGVIGDVHGSGLEALKSEADYDLILLGPSLDDLAIPIFLHQVRESSSLGKVPVVLMADRLSKESAKELISLGGVSLTNYPVNIDKVGTLAASSVIRYDGVKALVEISRMNFECYLLVQKLMSALDNQASVEEGLAELRKMLDSLSQLVEKTRVFHRNGGGVPICRLGKGHILVVEDDLEVADSIISHLHEVGVPVIYATNGAQALEVVAEKHVCLVVTDLKMPVMDGIEMVKILRGADPDLPVVFCTGAMTDSNGKIFIELGAHAILEKPFDFTNLLAVCRTGLDRYRARSNIRKVSNLIYRTYLAFANMVERPGATLNDYQSVLKLVDQNFDEIVKLQVPKTS